MRKILKGLAVIGVLATVGIVWLMLSTTKYESDRREAEWTSLTRSAHFLAGKTVPNAWAAGVFISDKAVNTVLTAVLGTAISYDPETNASEDTVLTVRDVKFEFNPGFPSGTFNLVAESKRRNLRVELQGEAALAFKGIKTTDPKQPLAQFGIQILKLEPNLRWHFFSLALRGYASELLATGTVLAFSKALSFDVPLPVNPSFDLSLDRKDHIPVRDPKNENWVDLATKLPVGEFRDELSFGYPIFIQGGMWIGADRRPGGQAELEVVTRGNKTDAQLDAEITDFRQQLTTVKGPGAGSGDLAIWLSGSLFGDILKKIAALSPERRTATIKSVAYQGQLAKKDWNDKILGKGGVFVELPRPDAVSGIVLIDSVSANWKPRTGLAFASHEKADAKVDIHVHVDPLIGGGVGTTVGMQGTSDINLNGMIAIKSVDVGGRAVVAMLPALECHENSITLKTDGHLVGDWGWTKVPQIGARLSAPTDTAILPPRILISDAPMPFRGRTDDDKGLPVKIGGDLFWIVPPWKMAELTVRPVEAGANEDGFLTAATVAVSLSPDWVDTTDERKKADEKLTSTFNESYKSSPCPGDTSFALLLGDMEFGPNNEIVKFLAAIGKLSKAAVQEAQRLGHELSAEKVQGWVQRPGDSLKRGEPGRILRRWGVKL